MDISQNPAFKLLGIIMLLGFGASIGLYGVTFGEHTFLLLATPLVIPLGVLLFIHPRMLFFILIASRCALDPILDSARFSSSFGLGAVLNVLMIICAFWLCVQRSEAPIRQSLLLWFAPLIVMIAGVAYAPVVLPALKTLVAFVSYLSVFTIGFILVLEGQLTKLLRTIVFSSIIPVTVGFYQLATGNMTPDGRLAATFTHPNIFAFYCLLVFVVLMYLQRIQSANKASGTSSFEKTLQCILIPALLISIVLTQTRSAWLALVAIGLVYGVLFSRKILIGMVVTVSVAALMPAVQDRVMDLFSGNEIVQYAKLNSFAWRQYIWESGLNWMSTSRYLLGYGIGGFYYYSVDFFPISGGYAFGAHNVFVERLFDGGLVAVTVFAIFFLVQISAAYKLHKHDKFSGVVYFALILSYLLLNTSDNVVGYLAYNWYYWVVAGGLYAQAQTTLSNPSSP